MLAIKMIQHLDIFFKALSTVETESSFLILETVVEETVSTQCHIQLPIVPKNLPQQSFLLSSSYWKSFWCLNSYPCWLKSWDLKDKVHSVAVLELSNVSRYLTQQMAAEIVFFQLCFNLIFSANMSNKSESKGQPTQSQNAHANVFVRDLMSWRTLTQSMSYFPALMCRNSSKRQQWYHRNQ